MSEASENVGNFHVVSMDGRTARFLTTTGLLDTQKALAWARKNISPESGCKYAVVQITKRINVDFKPRLVEAEYEPLPSDDKETDNDNTLRPDGTPTEILTDEDSKADLEGTPRPSKQAPPVVAPTVSEAPTETAAVADDAPPVEAPKPTPKAPPRPPAPPALKQVQVPLAAGSLATVAAPAPAPVAAAAPKAGPAIPKPPPPPRPPVAAPRPAAPAAVPAGGGGIDDLDLS